MRGLSAFLRVFARRVGFRHILRAPDDYNWSVVEQAGWRIMGITIWRDTGRRKDGFDDVAECMSRNVYHHILHLEAHGFPLPEGLRTRGNVCGYADFAARRRAHGFTRREAGDRPPPGAA